MGLRRRDPDTDTGELDRIQSGQDEDTETLDPQTPTEGVKMHLVRDHVSRDMLQTCVQLLEAAQAGQITGLAFACSMRGKKYFVNVSGMLARDPTFARGCIAALDDELGRMVQGKADSDTTL